jgi:hypothetical protein
MIALGFVTVDITGAKKNICDYINTLISIKNKNEKVSIIDGW